MKRVWVTKTGAKRDTHAVPGYDVVYQPLLKVVGVETAPGFPGPDAVVLFTSGNAVEHFCAHTKERHWPVMTVGDATANSAVQAGFEKVASADGDVEALVSLITRTVQVQSPLYYASAAQVSGELARQLRDLGYSVRREVFYKTVPVTTDPGPVDIVFLYSRKGAQAFGDLGLDTSKTEIICIAQSVDAALGNMPAKSRKIADNPTHFSMINQLDKPQLSLEARIRDA